jgi:hypothetical protein
LDETPKANQDGLIQSTLVDQLNLLKNAIWRNLVVICWLRRTDSLDEEERPCTPYCTISCALGAAECHFMAAYDCARRLKALNSLTPSEIIVKIRTSQPDRFTRYRG